VENAAAFMDSTLSAQNSSTRVSPHSGERPTRVVVIGGGLGGMSAAVALADAGLAVTLLEARRTLGGRAGSFDDPQTGETLDNCQHVLLGCCTNLVDFYRRIGALDHIRYDRVIRFMDPEGRTYGLSGAPGLPAPLHLGPSLLKFGALTWGERVALSRAMFAMVRLNDDERLALGDVSFGEWLDRHNQPASLVRKLYDPVLISALNEETRRASAAYAIQVFQGSLLSNAGGYVVGVPSCPLSELYGKLPAGVTVRTGQRVNRLVFAAGGNNVTAVELVGGEQLPADFVVLATGHHAARRLVPDELAATDPRFRTSEALEDVPILGVHLWFDRPVMSYPHVALIEGPLQWLFRKDAEGRALHGVISAAREWVGRPKDESLGRFERQVRSLFPAAREAKLERGVVVVEKRATFSPLPGVDRIRPEQAPPPSGGGGGGGGGLANVFLAGDYTRTGWPATMEGAVRSGYLAADALLRRRAATGAGAAERPPLLVPDLPVQWPSRLLRG
jgi:zeta-carotene desaturase